MKIHTFTIFLGLNVFLVAQVLAQLNFTDKAENLGVQINSSYSEVHPLVSPDGKTLYFNRKNHPNNTGGTEDEDEIWYSEFENGEWSTAKPFPAPLNNKHNNSIHSITPDGNTILLMNVYNYFDGSMSSGTSLAHRSRGGWTFPKKQNIEKYENKNDYVSYFLTNDGKSIIMSIQTKKKNFGERDLYVAHRNGENEWGKPINLGNVVNTSSDEGSPFLAADGTTLYYSTSGHEGGFGDNDIWKVKRLDDTWQNWSEPINMGKEINSEGWDSYFTIPASGKYAYFVSSKSGEGKEDIFRIRLPTEVKPDPVILISGRVFDAKTKVPIMAEVTYESLSNGKEIGVARSEPEGGTYKIVLPYGKAYGFLAKSEGYYSVANNIDISEFKDYQEIERDLYLKPIKKIEIGEVVVLNNIFFESAKSTLKRESDLELQRVMKLLMENPSLQIEISGHTDNIGDDNSNIKLSQDRAEAVVEYLITKGIKNDRLLAKGYGETSPISSNDTKEGRKLNRRVEFKVLKN
ncbi:MAG: OmpA family protein [Flavobacteriales bacterium]|nr:OmpA family protein [Flavobacteriales bacterium]